MKDTFFNFLIDAIVAFAIGVLTFLIGRESTGVGSTAAAGFAGIASGVATCLGFEFGKDSFVARKWNVIAGLIGAVVGGGLAACIGIG